jgi:hypothetical protein
MASREAASMKSERNSASQAPRSGAQPEREARSESRAAGVTFMQQCIHDATTESRAAACDNMSH